ncbi:MAG: phosphoenolpyruvate carboxykinase (GTP) [Proteobacteria bacterium]|nr:phosphoenolpyruvate carboxykinase (GTP) [Pseudomonadota bacterium]
MTKRAYFGTDGVRGLANGDVLTPELAMAVARSAAHELLALRTRAGRPLAVIGRDTRPSGPMLEAAAAAGFASAGVDVQLLGVVPTPDALDLDGLDLPARDLELLLSVDREVWRQEAELMPEYFAQFGDRLPQAISDEIAALRERLGRDA